MFYIESTGRIHEIDKVEHDVTRELLRLACLKYFHPSLSIFVILMFSEVVNFIPKQLSNIVIINPNEKPLDLSQTKFLLYNCEDIVIWFIGFSNTGFYANQQWQENPVPEMQEQADTEIINTIYDATCRRIQNLPANPERVISGKILQKEGTNTACKFGLHQE